MYKSIEYVIVYRGLVNNIGVRIYRDDGILYDRVFGTDRVQNQNVMNILKNKRYAVQYLQSDDIRVREIAKAVVNSDSVTEIDYNTYISGKVSQTNYHRNKDASNLLLS